MPTHTGSSGHPLVFPVMPGVSATPELPPEDMPPFPGLPKGSRGRTYPSLVHIRSVSPSILSTSRDLHPLGMPDPAGFTPFGFPLGETVPGDSLGVGLCAHPKPL